MSAINLTAEQVNFLQKEVTELRGLNATLAATVAAATTARHAGDVRLSSRASRVSRVAVTGRARLDTRRIRAPAGS